MSKFRVYDADDGPEGAVTVDAHDAEMAAIEAAEILDANSGAELAMSLLSMRTADVTFVVLDEQDTETRFSLTCETSYSFSAFEVPTPLTPEPPNAG